MRGVSRHGFTFIELMFAVVVLGIGMIGVAAALSVGSAQVQNTFDESIAARVAAGAYATLSHVMTKQNASALGNTGYVSFDSVSLLKTALQKELLSSSDRRYAWIPMYRLDPNNDALAQVIVVVVRCVSGTEYTAADVDPKRPDPLGVNPPTLAPRSMNVTITPRSSSPSAGQYDVDTVAFDSSPRMDVLASGAILVPAGAEDAGRIFKLGELLDAKAHVWSLAPGYDCGQNGGGYAGSALVVGRGYADPNDPSGAFAGASQAVAAYSMMVELR
ncbi:MAG: type IV pilus modification PilV family protein [Tepidisphaeraceae bacterium]